MKIFVRAGIAFCCSSIVAFAQLPSLSTVPSGVATQPYQSRGTAVSGGAQRSSAGLQLSSSGFQTMAASGESDFGRTTGSLNVSPSGAASFAIPIWTPPGPNGVQPSIALVYNSNAGNGVAGMGWNISATSAISRCPRTIHQDEAGAAIAMTLADRFCLDGNRLRLFSGTYGMAGSVYHTEIADYSRITAYGAAGNGPSYFIVEAKNGLRFEYGNTLDSRESAGGTTWGVLRWHLNKVSDRSGNNYIIVYTAAGGVALPSAIHWTPTSWGAATYRYEAQFSYDTDRIDLDSIYRGVSGQILVNRGRLNNIRIISAGTVVRKYILEYETSAVTSRSLLHRVKECADETGGNCFLPLEFTYQAGVAGLAAGAGAPPGGGGIHGGRYDFNGDGKDDIAYLTGGNWWVAFGATNGFSAPYSTGVSGGISIDRFLPNGRDAMATNSCGTLCFAYWDDAQNAFAIHNTGISSSVGVGIDYNGDGLADLAFLNSNQRNIQIRLNRSADTGALSFSDTLIATATLPTPSPPNSLNSWRYISILSSSTGLGYTDLNGDGREDLNMQVLWPGDNPPYEGYIATFTLVSTSSGYQVPPISQWAFNSTADTPSLHFNGDACTDRFVNNTVQLAPCADAWGNTITAPATPKILMDWDGDGKTDMLVDNGSTLDVRRSTGSGFSALIPTTISSAGTFLVADFDGDGLDDLIRTDGAYWTHTAGGTAPTYATNIPDLLETVTDGFGVSTTFNYVSTAWSNYNKGAATLYPLQESGPQIVVARATSSDGIGGTFNVDYNYQGARKHATRRSWVGFQRFDVTDRRSNLISRTYFEQQYPIAGMVSQRELMQANGTTPISRSVFSNQFTHLNASPTAFRLFPYTAGSTATQYEFGGSENGSLLRTVATTTLYDFASGTPYDRWVTTTEPASANGVAAGGEWKTHTVLPLANLTNDTTNWCLGRPGRVELTRLHNQAFSTPITRISSTTWNSSFCRPTQTVEEPESTDLKVTTDIGYDDFGNVSSTTVTGAGMPARATSTSYADATFTTGQFPLSVTNALGHQTRMDWDYDLGRPTTSTDPNGLVTAYHYDAFARSTGETRPDGTSNEVTYKSCTTTNTCAGFIKTQTISTEYDASQTPLLLTEVYANAFGQEVERWHRTGGGHYSLAMTHYDARGRVWLASAPCLADGTDCGTIFWTEHSYDDLDRLITVARRVSDSDQSSTWQFDRILYKGLSTTFLDPLQNSSTTITNAIGETVRSVDHNNYFQAFEFDAFGNVKRVTDSVSGASHPLQSSEYNLRGMLTSRADMDMGTWTYLPNALGEVTKVRDAKTSSPAWTTEFQYDSLGRLTYRNESEGESFFHYGTAADNTPANKYIGRLKWMSGPGSGYWESYVYDELGRPASTTFHADVTYLASYSYNDAGLLNTITYPASTGASPLKIKHEYQNGYLYRVSECPTQECTTLGTAYWTANKNTGREQISQETLGNGLVTKRVHDRVSGWLKSIKTGPGTSSTIQDLGYTWDLVGNLKTRTDNNQSAITEEFFYDSLYRLDYTTLTGQPIPYLDVNYDALGNITSKSDVGSYLYHATKKHQVTSAGGTSVGYDPNGNITSRGNTTLEWTSYNYPKCIRTGADCSGTGTDWSTFSYTPDRRYWKQISNYTVGGESATFYIGALLEKVQNSGGIDYRHMIRAGNATIIVSRQISGTNSVHYVTGDHLGSSSAITDSNGANPHYLSFDPFGKRRGSNWTGNPSSGNWTAIAGTTRRGYTEHSMFDNLTLIHMNGRVQDPVLGRFLSADPYIPDPMSTQSYNRYNYVQNNPLTLIDPSGFSEAPKYPPRPLPDAYLPPATCNGSTNFFNCLPFMQEDCSSYACLTNLYLGGGFAEASAAAATHNVHCVGCNQTILQIAVELMPGLQRDLLVSVGDTAALFTADNKNPVTGDALTPREVKGTREMLAMSVATGGMATMEATMMRTAANSGPLIYRAASGTPASMTPRAKDLKGLSASNSLENALRGKNQIIDTSKFRNLCATCDNPATGHVSITPTDMRLMQEWMNSRGGRQVHPLTQELMDAVIGTVVK